MLRKTLLIMALIMAAGILLTSAATAQLLPRLGVKAGLNLSSIDLDDLSASPRTGIVGGAFVALPIPFINLQGEILYSVKGLRKGRLIADSSAIDYREHLIEIPVLYKISLPIPLVSPSAYAGPALSFPLKGEVKTSRGWQTIDDDSAGKVWSLILGADVTLMSRLVLDMRYSWGVSKIRETNFLDDTAKKETIKDRTFSVTVGYKF